MGFANAVEMSESGWTLLPYGEWPHAEGVQRFTQASAEKIVSAFKGVWGQFKRAVIGLPVFKGHPDLRGLENQFPDKTEYGQIADMEARPEGLAVKQILSASGADLVRSGLRFISPHWLANAVGKTPSGAIIYEPVVMKSVGLTARPNIPNKSLVNTAEFKSMNKEKLLALLATLSCVLKPLANETEVADDVIEAKIKEAFARPTADALANEKSATLAATQRAQAAETDLAKLKTDLETATKTLANETKKRTSELLDGATKLGIITVAQRPLWQKRLELDYPSESVALVNSNPAIKTAPTVEATRLAAVDGAIKKTAATGALANVETGGKDLAGLVNEEMASANCANIKDPNRRRAQAMANVEKKFPTLFAPVQTAT